MSVCRRSLRSDFLNGGQIRSEEVNICTGLTTNVRTFIVVTAAAKRRESSLYIYIYIYIYIYVIYIYCYLFFIIQIVIAVIMTKRNHVLKFIILARSSKKMSVRVKAPAGVDKGAGGCA